MFLKTCLGVCTGLVSSKAKILNKKLWKEVK